MIADIGNDILQDFRQIAESCSPYASLRPGDRPGFERMAWYIQENCSTIQLLLSPDGDPEFFQKWVEQFQQMLYRRLEDGNVHASPDLDRILYFLAQNSVRMIVDALPQQPIPIILQALEVTDLIMAVAHMQPPPSFHQRPYSGSFPVLILNRNTKTADSNCEPAVCFFYWFYCLFFSRRICL